MRTTRPVVLAPTLAFLALLAGSPALAQRGVVALRQTMGPCPYDPIDARKYGNQPFVNPPDVKAVEGVLTATLALQYTDPKAVSLGGEDQRAR